VSRTCGTHKDREMYGELLWYNLKEKRPLRIRRCRCEDNIKMDMQGMVYEVVD